MCPYRELIPFAESIHADRILRENNEKMRQEFHRQCRAMSSRPR